MFEESIRLATASWSTVIDNAFRAFAMLLPICTAAGEELRGISLVSRISFDSARVCVCPARA